MTLPIVLLVLLVGVVGYVAGRVHQWLRADWERDEAYRDGYDTAARSTFSLAARMVGPRRARESTGRVVAPAAAAARPGAEVQPGQPVPTATVPGLAAAEGDEEVVVRRGRHFVPDELVRAATYRLSPDRVARARVVPAREEPPAQQASGEGVTTHPPVPRPRSS